MPPTRSSAAAVLGADPDELDRAASELRTAADQLDGQAGELTAVLSAVAWIGGAATWFTGQWNGTHRSRIDATSRHLREAAAKLVENAAEQRLASTRGVAPGSAGSAPGAGHTDVRNGQPGTPHVDGVVRHLETVFGRLGLAGAELRVVSEYAQQVAGDVVGERVIEMLASDGVAQVLRDADHAIDVSTLLVDVLVDVGEHPDLPVDDRIVHGIVDAGLRFAVSEGAEKGAEMLAVTLTASLLPTFGAVMAPVVSRAAGAIAELVVNQAVEAVDGATGVVDWTADRAVEIWREVKAAFGVLVDVGEAVGTVVGGAVDLAGGAAQWLDTAVDEQVDEVGRWLGDHAAGAVHDVGGWLGIGDG